MYVMLHGRKTFHLYSPWDKRIKPNSWEHDSLNNTASIGSVLAHPPSMLSTPQSQDNTETSTIKPVCDTQALTVELGPFECLFIPR